MEPADLRRKAITMVEWLEHHLDHDIQEIWINDKPMAARAITVCSRGTVHAFRRTAEGHVRGGM